METTTGGYGKPNHGLNKAWTSHEMDGGQMLLQRLREAGLRPTVARIEVMQLLEAATPRRLDAEAVLRALLARGIGLSPGTVYRTLKDLVARGLLLQEWRKGQSGSKAAYGPRPYRREALDWRIMCERCGCATSISDPALQEQLRQLALRQGLSLAAQPMTILAVCSQCLPAGRRRWPAAAEPTQDRMPAP